LSTITVKGLTDQEKLVLEAVLEFLEQNRPFSITEALPFIISRFRLASININNHGIKVHLKSLIKKNYIFEESKLAKPMILDHQMRNQLYEFIVRHPGCYFNRLIKQFNLNNKILVWHIRMLEKFGFIRRELFDNRYIYSDAKLDSREAKRQYIASKERSKIILDYLKNNNVGLTMTHISDALNMHLNTTKKYLDLLESMNFIIKEKIDNNLLYFLN